MPRFSLVQHPRTSSISVPFEEFVEATKGLSVSSAAASSTGSRGPDFLELGLSKAFNLRLQAQGDNLIVTLIPTLNPGEFAPIRVEIVGDGEEVTAELLQRRLHYLRQVYATALLLKDGRENELASALQNDLDADLEHDLVAEDEKLLIREATPGSLVLSLVAKSKKAYQAILYACAVPFSQGRKALLGRVVAGTALAELEVQAKAQDLRLKGAHGLLDLAKKIDGIKDDETRDLIRRRLLADMAGLVSTETAGPKPLALEHSQNIGASLDVRLQSEPVRRPGSRAKRSKRHQS